MTKSLLHDDSNGSSCGDEINIQQKQINDNPLNPPKSIIKSNNLNNTNTGIKKATTKATVTNNKTSKHNNVTEPKSLTRHKKVIILGDSMVKGVNGWELTNKINNCKVVVRDFSSARVECMADHMRPSLREGADHYILHVGTNDLVTKRSPIEIAESVMEQALSLKNENHDVSISNIIIRRDKWKTKAEEVNVNLKDMCMKNNMFYVDHTKSLKQQHLNRSRLHLNSKGNIILGKTFVSHISNIFN